MQTTGLTCLQPRQARIYPSPATSVSLPSSNGITVCNHSWQQLGLPVTPSGMDSPFPLSRDTPMPSNPVPSIHAYLDRATRHALDQGRWQLQHDAKYLHLLDAHPPHKCKHTGNANHVHHKGLQGPGSSNLMRGGFGWNQP